MKNPELINWKLESHKGEVNHYSRNVFFFNSAANEVEHTGQKRETVQNHV